MKRLRKATCPMIWLIPLLLGGCGPGAGVDESRLTVYSAGPRPLAEAIARSFTEETGIVVDLFQASTGQIMARLEAERYRPRADVVIFASEVAAAAMKGDDLLHPIQPDVADLLQSGWSDPDGFYWASGAALVGIAVRADAAIDPLPRWVDWFLLPDARRIVMPSPSRSGASGDFVVAYALHDPGVALDGFQQLRSSGMDFAAANSQAIGGLLMGAYDIMIGAADYLIYRQIGRGEPLELLYPDEGGALVIRPIAILASSPRIPAAESFVNHYLGDESQKRVADAFLLPARQDIESHPLRGELPALIRADPHQAVSRQAALLRRFQLAIERAVVIEPPKGFAEQMLSSIPPPELTVEKTP